jgi:glycosyltransferase involved in cell wall biosynthesis
MKIAILGTRGVPNYHGGFEQFAEHFSVFLAKSDHEVYVYNSSSHPYKKEDYKGVKILHCLDPEHKIGKAGQFIYDLNCILDSRKRNFDIILQLGYTSNSIWYKLLPNDAIVITNMDGLEWKRSKYSKRVQKFLKYAEKLAIKSSDYLISDSKGIQRYLGETYLKDSKYIAYGATPVLKFSPAILKDFQLKPFKYNMLIARLEPENNIETILDGIVKSNSNLDFLVIGKYDTSSFGNYIFNKFNKFKSIKFLGGIYNQNHLNDLRYYSNLYFHGHSVGGTNPSLLEAMANECLIIANDNDFNKSILQGNAFYFNTINDIENLTNCIVKTDHLDFLANNIESIKANFSWNKINNEYLNFFYECLKK